MVVSMVVEEVGALSRCGDTFADAQEEARRDDAMRTSTTTSRQLGRVNPPQKHIAPNERPCSCCERYACPPILRPQPP